MALQKNSPFLGLFNYCLTQKRLTGILNKMDMDDRIQPQSCPNLSGKPLTITSCFTAFIVLFFGICFGLLIWVFELLGNKMGCKWIETFQIKSDVLSREVEDLINKQQYEILLLRNEIRQMKRNQSGVDCW